jgi:hypothetical protein
MSLVTSESMHTFPGTQGERERERESPSSPSMTKPEKRTLLGGSGGGGEGAPVLAPPMRAAFGAMSMVKGERGDDAREASFNPWVQVRESPLHWDSLSAGSALTGLSGSMYVQVHHILPYIIQTYVYIYIYIYIY